MSESYEEILDGEIVRRSAPGPRHDIICQRLRARMEPCVAQAACMKFLEARAEIKLNSKCAVRPDAAVVAAPTGKLWLVAEVIQSGDHRADTVVKKQIYDDLKLPRLWMVDPRYNNVEIYHGTEHGLALKGILAARDFLEEKLLPEFRLSVGDLFDALPPG